MFPNPNVTYDCDLTHLKATITALREYSNAAIRNVGVYKNKFGTQGVYLRFSTATGVHHMISLHNCPVTKLNAKEIANAIESVKHIPTDKAGFYRNHAGKDGYFASVQDPRDETWIMIGRSSDAKDFSGMPFDKTLRDALQEAVGGNLQPKSRGGFARQQALPPLDASDH